MQKRIKAIISFIFSALILSAPFVANAAGTCTVQNTDCLSPKTPTFWLITSSAFVDSINPCAIAVLLFVLSALVFLVIKRRY